MTDFLLELRSEEIPARMQDDARQNLKRLFEAQLAKAGLKADAIATYATPRRLALTGYGLPVETQAVSEEIKGPKVSAPAQAIEGFLRKNGLMQDQLAERDGVYFALLEKPGRATADVLAEAIPAIIRAFPWPKSMRWGAASVAMDALRWVRPLQGIVALFGDDIVPCAIGGIESGRDSMGHRFHHSGVVSIDNAANYEAKLRAAHVMVSQDERENLIRGGAHQAAAEAGLTLVQDPGLVTENAGLTEWPVPLLGRFDAAFLTVPREVIQLTMRTNQKYFACTDGSGALANAFLCTANIVASDGGAGIVAGNQKVLAARLSDAKFFWEQDLKIPLAEQAAKLGNIVFHEKLGTVADKVERVAKLARWLVESGVVKPSPLQGRGSGEGVVVSGITLPSDVPLSPTLSPEGEREALADQAETAARLCKADLVTGMVGEFPELQGIMGGYYARAQGYPGAVADAIRDHYKPVGQSDDVPTAPVTVAVSLADKLDTVVSFFVIGQPPTGSKDPYSLRRAALGALALIVANDLRLSTETVFGWIRDQILRQGVADARPTNGNIYAEYDRVAMADLTAFIQDRLKVQQREAGVRHDLIDAVFALGGEDDLVRLLARVKALQEFVTTDEGANLLAGYKRAANILKAVDKPSARQGSGLGAGGVMTGVTLHSDIPLSPTHSPEGEREEAEGALQTALTHAETQASAAIAQEDFQAAMNALASLRAPIDAFFDGVMVNDPDPAIRAQRLGLLARFRDAVHKVADFSKIEG